MLRNILGAALFFTCLAVEAQYIDLGSSSQPHDTTSIDDLIFYGNVLDFSGGYQVGDLVANFTLYDFDGNPVNLYEELQGEKPVALVSGSATCLRFTNSYYPEAISQEYFAIRNFIDNYEDLYNWIYVYGVEAHPNDGNCPSNCPPTAPADTNALQHPDYHYRRWALKNWVESAEHEFTQDMYADNPDNAVYNTFFQRPFGMLVFNCDATVALRADWFNTWIGQNHSTMLSFAQNYDACGFTWEPIVDEEEDTEEEDTEEEDTEEEDTEEEDTEEEDTEEEDTEEEDTEEEDTEEEDTEEEDTEEEDTEEEDVEEEEDDTEDPYTGPETVLDAVTSVNDLEAAHTLLVFPNPATHTATLVVPSAFVQEQVNLRVFGLNGRMVYETRLQQERTALDVSQWSKGLYLIELTGKDGYRVVHRLAVH